MLLVALFTFGFKEIFFLRKSLVSRSFHFSPFFGGDQAICAEVAYASRMIIGASSRLRLGLS